MSAKVVLANLKIKVLSVLVEVGICWLGLIVCAETKINGLRSHLYPTLI